MLRMDGFAYHHARSPEEAIALHAELPEARYIAGGTDILPNIKHRILRPQNLIGLTAALPSGWRIRDEDGALVIGAGTTIDALSQLTSQPALAAAAAQIAGPQIRNMATLGGNILLDTRCLFYNQTEFWRKSLGYCLKAEGDWCHVIGGPKTCVAIQSSDTVPLLLAFDARITLLGPEGSRELSMRELYRFDGMNHLKIAPGELLVEVTIPSPGDGHRATYRKLRTRGAIDFPQLGVAISGTFEGTGPSATVSRLDIVVGAINPQPKPARKLDGHLGQPLTDDRIAEIAGAVYKQTRPVAAVHGDTTWRRHMAEVFTRRALTALRDGV
ncbi:MAG: 4-hydroxybenzoyl-CoA reductase subunit beta [Myxococcota bacterium]|jgi:4-hydroxybenzoyl-CoA reductase subunit beta